MVIHRRKKYIYGEYTVGRVTGWFDLDYRYFGLGVAFNVFGERTIDVGLPFIRFGVEW